jgi:hypothetical protein
MPLLAPSVVPSRQGIVVRYKGDAETETIDQLVKADHDKVSSAAGGRQLLMLSRDFGAIGSLLRGR